MATEAMNANWGLYAAVIHLHGSLALQFSSFDPLVSDEGTTYKW